MTTQTTPSEFIDALTAAAKAACVTRQAGRGTFGEGKADAKLPDGRTVQATYSVSTSLWGKEVLRTSFTIDGKRASKEQISVALGGRTKEMVAELNPQLRAEFEAQAPQLEADFIKYVKGWFENTFAKYEGKIPAYPSASKYSKYEYQNIAQLRQYCNIVAADGDRSGRNSTLSLNEAHLAKVAKQYGEEAAVQWFYKTNAKLGKLDDATLVNDNQHGYVVVKGTRDGKEVVLRQQRVGKTNQHGTYFHQFPALLYVDGKKTTEAAYKKLFGDKE
jgi:hypothetical protein